MTYLFSHLRHVLVAFVVLGLSAGIALAADGGLATAREASGQVVPVGAGAGEDEDTDEQEAPEVDATTETEQDADAPSAGSCTDTDPANHGALVCWAAQQEPDGWTNHGEWVSCVARLSNKGHTVEGQDPIVWADLTPEACSDALAAQADARAAAKEARAAERDALKAERRAGKSHGPH